MYQMLACFVFPILPGMDFSGGDPEGTPNRRWRAV
jgi:hypothetical protein